MYQEAVYYFAVSACIVCIGAPIGSFLSSFVHRIMLCLFLCVADLVQFIAALIIVPMDLGLWLIVVATTFISGSFFFVVTKLGAILMEKEKRLGGYRDLDWPEPTLEVVGESEGSLGETSTAEDSLGLDSNKKESSYGYDVERERLVFSSSQSQCYSALSDGTQKAPLP